MPESSVLVAIGRLEGKVDALISSLKSHSGLLSEHDARLRSLEQGRAWILGAAAVVGAFSSVVVKVIGSL